MSKLHSSIKVGPYEFSHRVVLAPLTRMRAEEGAKSGPLMAEPRPAHVDLELPFNVLNNGRSHSPFNQHIDWSTSVNPVSICFHSLHRGMPHILRSRQRRPDLARLDGYSFPPSMGNCGFPSLEDNPHFLSSAS